MYIEKAVSSVFFFFFFFGGGGGVGGNVGVWFVKVLEIPICNIALVVVSLVGKISVSTHIKSHQTQKIKIPNLVRVG